TPAAVSGRRLEWQRFGHPHPKEGHDETLPSPAPSLLRRRPPRQDDGPLRPRPRRAHPAAPGAGFVGAVAFGPIMGPPALPLTNRSRSPSPSKPTPPTGGMLALRHHAAPAEASAARRTNSRRARNRYWRRRIAWASTRERFAPPPHSSLDAPMSVIQ